MASGERMRARRDLHPNGVDHEIVLSIVDGNKSEDIAWIPMIQGPILMQDIARAIRGQELEESA